MSKDPWHTERWFTSPWNFLPEVRDHLEIPTSVQVHDVTLRDREQQAGIVFTKDDKLRIAEALAEAGVHRIEGGLPAVSPADEVAIRGMVKSRTAGSSTRTWDAPRAPRPSPSRTRTSVDPAGRTWARSAR